MKVDLNNYKYSYANSIGYTLREPLYRLISSTAISLNPHPLEDRAVSITKIALYCLATMVFILPLGMLWLTGKAISYFSQTQIDYETLHLAPPPLNLQKDHLEAFAIKEISDRYNQLNIPNTRARFQTTTSESLKWMCDKIETQASDIYPAMPQKRDLFYTEMTLYLKNIVKKLRSGELSQDKEREILIELAHVSIKCYPTWIEVASKIYTDLYQPQTPEIKLLKMVQEYKEDLILEFNSQKYEWHILNYVRNVLGSELGLNTNLNEYDPYAGQNHAIFSKALTKWFFLQRYGNVNRLVSSIQAKINSKYDDAIFDYMKFLVEQRGVEKPGDFVAESFYTENDDTLETLINYQGVNFLLRSIGILK